MDTWYIYARVDLPYDENNPRASADIEDYLDYAEREGFELAYYKFTRNEDGLEVVRFLFSMDTHIQVTGDNIEGGEPDEILFEPDEIDEDPNEWVENLTFYKDACIVGAFFDLY